MVAPEEGKYHDFESPESHHYYIASSQYYKMLHHNVASRNKITIQNKPNSIQSIEHIVNKKTLDIYNQMKKTFKEQGKVTEDKKVRELLLFHATDAKNIDSILQNGFNIDHDPQHKQKKMVFGRGVYFSEHPEISFFYGNKILLCKVRIMMHLIFSPVSSTMALSFIYILIDSLTHKKENCFLNKHFDLALIGNSPTV